MQNFKLLFATLLLLSSCSVFFPIKRTEFYKDGKLVKTFIGRGVYDGSGVLGNYRILSIEHGKYEEFHCEGCKVVETRIPKEELFK